MFLFHAETEYQLMFEPGRSLVASSCVLLCTVLGLKASSEPGVDYAVETDQSEASIASRDTLSANQKPGSGVDYAVVDAAMTDLIRPALYGAYHHVVRCRHHDVAPCDGNVETGQYHIVGPVCESADFIAFKVKLPKLKKGNFNFPNIH